VRLEFAKIKGSKIQFEKVCNRWETESHIKSSELQLHDRSLLLVVYSLVTSRYYYMNSVQCTWLPDFHFLQGVALTGRSHVTVLACRAVSAARPPTRPAGRPPEALQTTTDASEQNNTGSLGGPVMRQSKLQTTCTFRFMCKHIVTWLIHVVISWGIWELERHLSGKSDFYVTQHHWPFDRPHTISCNYVSILYHLLDISYFRKFKDVM